MIIHQYISNTCFSLHFSYSFIASHISRKRVLIFVLHELELNHQIEHILIEYQTKFLITKFGQTEFLPDTTRCFFLLRQRPLCPPRHPLHPLPKSTTSFVTLQHASTPVIAPFNSRSRHLPPLTPSFFVTPHPQPQYISF